MEQEGNRWSFGGSGVTKKSSGRYIPEDGNPYIRSAPDPHPIRRNELGNPHNYVTGTPPTALEQLQRCSYPIFVNKFSLFIGV